MLKKDLIDRVSKQLVGRSRKIIAETIEIIVKDIEQALADERRVEMR